MLLVHQAGSVKVGEVVRYTVTYRPADDRILPTPSHLHVKVKNTSAIPLRAAFIHGPYCLHISAYSSNFNPHVKVDNPGRDGIPDYEPMLKAAGSWTTKLLVPEEIRETGADLGKKRQNTQSGTVEDVDKGSVTWIIEVESQIMFSTSAAVNYEVLIGRDERSLDLGFAAVAGHGHGGPGKVQQHATERERKKARRDEHVQTAGVYSKAVKLRVEDTEALWDKPPLPSKEDEEGRPRETTTHVKRTSEDEKVKNSEPRKRRKVHLVIVTHGLHSNLGADMLFLKESIDATVKRAREDKQKRKEEKKKQQQQNPDASSSANAEKADQVRSSQKEDEDPASTAPLSGGQEDTEAPPDDEDDDEEETIVRGFPGNAVKTENGIQYLGKRLAKYILRFTYPDQPYLPVKKGLTRALTDTFKSDANKAKRDGLPSHAGSSIHSGATEQAEDLPYTFTSISFVGHSLGGLVQTYAAAYIHKHSPTFFDNIKPVNFICLASPMLGLSNENPMYVKFALDFGLVGRTGQDLGLTWRAPTIAKGGWNAVFGGQGAAQKHQQDQEHGDPTSKPLLRILPTGPAHRVLRMFRNRTVYSNVVNDGIVPLRTSCLLFLDWRGLGKVDKARRENGLIGTVAEWGWNEITGQNSSAASQRVPTADRVADQVPTRGEDDEDNEHVRKGEGETVPQPDANETADDARTLTTKGSYDETTAPARLNSAASSTRTTTTQQTQPEKGVWDNFLDFFRAGPQQQPQQPTAKRSTKTKKAFTRGQTVFRGEDEMPDDVASGREGTTTNPMMRPHIPRTGTKEDHKRPGATRGDSMIDTETGELVAPPKTSIFESAGDILHPPLPSAEWISNPSSRARTIFHDRVYHPEDIPPPPPSKRPTNYGLGFSSSKTSLPTQSSGDSTLTANSQQLTEAGGMKVEEKIARAYHRDLSWRKVLVRLEPDAHNNIIVRRMFANAYGWPVIKHLCDTHFADTHAANTRDEYEPARERAPPLEAPATENGEEVKEQTARTVPPRTDSETREARDELTDLDRVHDRAGSTFSSTTSRAGKTLSRMGSAQWDDSYFEVTDDDDSDVDERNVVSRMLNPMPLKKPEQSYQPTSPKEPKRNGTPRTPTSPYTEGHRGLAPTSPTVMKSPESTKSTFDASNVDASSPIVANRLVAEPEPLGSTADLGLGKTVEEQVSLIKKRPRSQGAGAGEGVGSSDKARE